MADENLCDIPVTKEALEKIFHDNFPSKAKLEHVEAKVISKGMGFLSDVLRAKLKWSVENGLPSTVIIKSPHIEHINKMIDDMGGGPPMPTGFVQLIHKTECNAYSVVQNDPPIPIPKIYACLPITETSPGLIIMEDLGDRGGILGSLADGVTLEQWRNVVAALADLHAWSLTTDVNWQEKVGGIEALEELFQGFDEMTIKAVQDSKEKYPEYFANVNEEVVAKELSSKRQIEKHVEIRNSMTHPVLQHGDTWINNIFFNKKPDGTFGDTVVAFLDWQMSMKGAGVLDMGRFETWCLNRDMRRKHYREMLRFYYDRLKSKAGDKVDFSFEKLEKVYEQAFALNGFMCASMVEVMLGTIAKVGDDPRKKKEMLERLQGAYEDAMKFSGYSS